MWKRIAGWIRRRPRRSAVAAAIGLVVAGIAALNNLPAFVDQTLPWLGQHVSLGPIATTVWQSLWVIPFLMAGTLLVLIWRNTQPRTTPVPAHFLGMLRPMPGISGIAAGLLVSGHPFLALYNDGEIELTYRVDKADAMIGGRPALGGPGLPITGNIGAGQHRNHGLGQVVSIVAGSRLPERIEVSVVYGPTGWPPVVRGIGTLTMTVAFDHEANAISGQVAADYAETIIQSSSAAISSQVQT